MAAGARAHRVDAPGDGGCQRRLDFLADREQGAPADRARARLVDVFCWRGRTDGEDAADRTFDTAARKLLAPNLPPRRRFPTPSASPLDVPRGEGEGSGR